MASVLEQLGETHAVANNLSNRRQARYQRRMSSLLAGPE